jgi:hypothetical protein
MLGLTQLAFAQREQHGDQRFLGEVLRGRSIAQVAEPVEQGAPREATTELRLRPGISLRGRDAAGKLGIRGVF